MNELRPKSEREVKKRRRTLLASLLAAILAAAIVATGLYFYQKNQLSEAPHDLNGNPVKVEPGELPSQDQVDKMKVEDSIDDPTGGNSKGKELTEGSSNSSSNADGSSSQAKPLRLRVPSRGLDVQVGALSSVGGVIHPPGFTRAYIVRNVGESLQNNSKGTTYVVMHSVKSGLAPGNKLIDVQAGKAKVTKGESVYLGSNEYKVTGSDEISKGQLPNTKEVWKNEPNRVVLITCLQRERGRSLENVVVYAERVNN